MGALPDPQVFDSVERQESLIISALYSCIFKRSPDPDGYRHYTQILHEQGLEHGLSQILNDMLGSAEYRALNPPPRYPGGCYEIPVFLLEQSDPRIQYQAGEPSFSRPVWQLCTAKQLRDPVFEFWRTVRRSQPQLHRKVWEYSYILQSLHTFAMLEPGCRGLGFAVGHEPLAAIMAARGCEIVATDAPSELAAADGWINSNQHAGRLDDLNCEALCDRDKFYEKVKLRYVDMNNIPNDLTGFDFLWSSCAFEHLGSTEDGLQFVERAMHCLRPGGVAVHTTEFNLSSNRLTIDGPPNSFYRKRDIEALYVRLLEAGHKAFPLNLWPGVEPEDLHVDIPPYFQEIPAGGREPAHLKFLYKDPRLSIVATSIGIIVQRGNRTDP